MCCVGGWGGGGGGGGGGEWTSKSVSITTCSKPGKSTTCRCTSKEKRGVCEVWVSDNRLCTYTLTGQDNNSDKREERSLSL